MFSAIYLTIVVIIRCAPSLLGGYMDVDPAYDMYYISDLLTISLLLWYIYLTFTWEQRYIKFILMVTLIINFYFIISYHLSGLKNFGFIFVGV